MLEAKLMYDIFNNYQLIQWWRINYSCPSAWWLCSSEGIAHLSTKRKNDLLHNFIWVHIFCLRVKQTQFLPNFYTRDSCMWLKHLVLRGSDYCYFFFFEIYIFLTKFLCSISICGCVCVGSFVCLKIFFPFMVLLNIFNFKWYLW